MSAFWGGQEGSLLLWLLVLSAYSAAAVLLNRRRAPDLVAWTVPVLGGVSVFFAFMLVVVSSPFATQAAPAEGAASTRASRTRTCWRTRRSSTWDTSG